MPMAVICFLILWHFLIMNFCIQSNPAFIWDKVMALASQVFISLIVLYLVVAGGCIRLINVGWVVVVMVVVCGAVSKGKANLMGSNNDTNK